MVARCKVRFRDSVQAIVTDAQWVEYLTEGYEHVWTASPYWPWRKTHQTTVTINPGTNTTPLPSNVWRVLGVMNTTNNWVMQPMYGDTTPWAVYPMQAQAPNTPTMYRLFNRNIEVFPWPNEATTFLVDYVEAYLTTLFDAGTESPIFPTEYHPILVDWAVGQAYIDDGNPGQGQVYLDMFQDKLEKMKMDLLGADTQGNYYRIQDTW